MFYAASWLIWGCISGLYLATKLNVMGLLNVQLSQLWLLGLHWSTKIEERFLQEEKVRNNCILHYKMHHFPKKATNEGDDELGAEGTRTWLGPRGCFWLWGGKKNRFFGCAMHRAASLAHFRIGKSLSKAFVTFLLPRGKWLNHYKKTPLTKFLSYQLERWGCYTWCDGKSK